MKTNANYNYQPAGLPSEKEQEILRKSGKRKPQRRGEIFSSKDKSLILKGVFCLGLIAILMVMSSAYCAGVNYSNNLLREENIALRGEVDSLSARLQSANNITHIEKVAMEDLGMVYAEGDFFVNLSTMDKPDGDLAGLLKAQAYQ